MSAKRITKHGRDYVQVDDWLEVMLVEKVPKNAEFMFAHDGYKFYRLKNGTEVAVQQ